MGGLEITGLSSRPVACVGVWDRLAPRRYGLGTFSAGVAEARARARAAQPHVAALLICYAAILNGTWDFELYSSSLGYFKGAYFYAS